MSFKVFFRSLGLFIVLFLLCEAGARLYHLTELKNFPAAPDRVDDLGTFEKMLRAWKEGLYIEDIEHDVHAYYSPVVGTINRPNDVVKIKNHDWEINSLGFRGPELVMPKPKGVFRVFILGASTVSGGPNEKWTIDYYLQKDLRQFIPNVEVINAGVPGYTSQNELLLLETRILKLEPDLVIVIDGSNTLYLSMHPEQSPVAMQERILNKLVNHATLPTLITYDLRYLFHKSYFVMLLYRKLFVNRIPAGDISGTKISAQEIANYLDDLQLMKAVLDAKHVRGMLVFQPALNCGKAHLSDYEKSIFAYFQSHGLVNWLNQVKTIWPSVGLEVQKIPPSPFVRAYDFSRVFENENETMYLDSVHYSPAGDAKIAAAMARVIHHDF